MLIEGNELKRIIDNMIKEIKDLQEENDGLRTALFDYKHFIHITRTPDNEGWEAKILVGSKSGGIDNKSPSEITGYKGVMEWAITKAKERKIKRNRIFTDDRYWPE